MSHMNIQSLSYQNRPRERFIMHGVKSLSDAELLAIIIGKGYGKENVLDLANNLLSKYPIEKLSDFSMGEFMKINGIGKVKAMQIISLFEFNRRHYFAKKNKDVVSFKSPKDVFKYFVDELYDVKQEYFYSLLLDSNNQLIKKELITIGTISASIVHPREIFRPAIKESSSSIILVHNHPTGNVDPSPEDISVTKIIREAGEIIGIKVLDHVIIGKDNYRSI